MRIYISVFGELIAWSLLVILAENQNPLFAHKVSNHSNWILSHHHPSLVVCSNNFSGSHTWQVSIYFDLNWSAVCVCVPKVYCHSNQSHSFANHLEMDAIYGVDKYIHSFIGCEHVRHEWNWCTYVCPITQMKCSDRLKITINERSGGDVKRV